MGLPDSPPRSFQGFCCVVSRTVWVCVRVYLRLHRPVPSPSGIKGIHAANSGSNAIPGGLAPRDMVSCTFSALNFRTYSLRHVIHRPNANRHAMLTPNTNGKSAMAALPKNWGKKIFKKFIGGFPSENYLFGPLRLANKVAGVWCSLNRGPGCVTVHPSSMSASLSVPLKRSQQGDHPKQ